MTQEEKQLLLKDLCARLPYGVKALYYDYVKEKEVVGIIDTIYTEANHDIKDGSVGIIYWRLEFSEIKPYLFPLSSMTEEQKKELQSLMVQDAYGILYHTIESYDYFNKHHFDYRDLIPKGLAIDATGLGIY